MDGGDDGTVAGSEAALSAVAQVDKSEEDETAFKKGRRNKKLMNLLKSKGAQQVVSRFQNHSILATLLLLGAHIGCFVGILYCLDVQKTYLDNLNKVGNLSRSGCLRAER